MKYIKQLDSLRAIAVIMVIISHWAPIGSYARNLSLGAIGVDVFFVLSGFLISKILLDQRNKIELNEGNRILVMKDFYIRRSLRIFPIYYLTIFTLYYLSEHTETNIASAFGYFFTYTSNFYFFKIQSWDGMISHLWSLSVEEQFYLILPWFIIFCNRKYILHVIIGFIIIGVASQYVLGNVKMGSILTFSCFDAFGFGALLAWFFTYRTSLLKKFVLFLLGITIPCICIYKLGHFYGHNLFPLRTLTSLISVIVICYILIYHNRESLRFKIILNNKVLIFLGKISYGLYLYHNLMPALVSSKTIIKLNYTFFSSTFIKDYRNYLEIIEQSLLLLFLSWLSFKLIEKPFLNLKSRIAYATTLEK